MYLLELGPSEQNLAKQAMRAGQPIPDRIANAPELINGLELYINAFFDLDSERSHATAPTPIPWRAIAEYAAVFDFDEEQRDDLFFFIKRLDSEHLKRLAEKMKPKGGSNGANPSRFSRTLRKVR